MRIAVVYNLAERSTGNIPLPDGWDAVLRRFAESYLNFDAGYAHDLYICSSGASLSSLSKEIFKAIPYKPLTYMGGGWDIGAYQYAAEFLKNYALVVCLNSQAHIAHANWLKYFADAFDRYGDGVYGASSSFQVSPHIRTSCIAFAPHLILQYPLKVRCRYDACVFEHSPTNFSLWALGKGLPVFVVMLSGVYKLSESRLQSGSFRRGKQENLLIKDRHTIIFKTAPDDQRELLTKLADGDIANPFIYLNRIEHFIARHAALQNFRNFVASLRINAIRFLRSWRI
jgi:hypothetical protein